MSAAFFNKLSIVMVYTLQKTLFNSFYKLVGRQFCAFLSRLSGNDEK